MSIEEIELPEEGMNEEESNQEVSEEATVETAPGKFDKLLGEHTLYDYLLQLNNDAEDTFNRLVKQMAEREGVTEQLKADNQMLWVGLMNNIRQRATEIVNAELIYV